MGVEGSPNASITVAWLLHFCPHDYTYTPIACSSQSGASSARSNTQRNGAKIAWMPQIKCSSCDELQKEGEVFIRCVSCHMQAHASCLEMSDEMVACVATYPWQCIECKRCTVCSLGDQEESMIFCDKCDRGFHTHCIGLAEAPQGSWICQQYCNPQNNLTVTPRRPASRKRSIIAT